MNANHTVSFILLAFHASLLATCLQEVTSDLSASKSENDFKMTIIVLR